MDATRTILVGEGQGGIVAFNAAMRAPRLYAGVLTLDAPILTNLTSSYIPAAVSAGVRVRVLVNNEEMFGLPKEQIATFTGQMRTGLRTSKLDHELTNYTPNAEQPGQRRALCTEKLRALLPVQSPAEGQTEGKPVEAGTGGK
jgi:pimeloyl-ACP methyl ester carboxylesterase